MIFITNIVLYITSENIIIYATVVLLVCLNYIYYISILTGNSDFNVFSLFPVDWPFS